MEYLQEGESDSLFAGFRKQMVILNLYSLNIENIKFAKCLRSAILR